MPRQLTFPQVMDCTHIHPDGREENVRYGKFEAIIIVAENGWPTDRTVPAIVPSHFVTEVTKEDGTRVVFGKPWFLLYEREYGDGSGRIAPRLGR